MPRKAQGPRLYLDPKRKQWVIRDGQNFIRTGCPREDHEGAQKQLGEYIGSKYRPTASPSPLIADVLLVYAKERLPKTLAPDRAAHNISNLVPYWGNKRAEDVNAHHCNTYASDRPQAAARRDLEVLRAALLYWNRHKSPLSRIPTVVLPPKSQPRDRWLTAEEARKLRRAAMKYPHLYRFIVLGLKTGSRSGVLFNLRWKQIDLQRGVMDRKALGEAEASNKRKPPVRLGRAVVRLLKRWRAKDGKVEHVIHYDGQPVKKLRRSWAAACKEAGLSGISPHTLRHTRATWLTQAGVPMWEIAGHMGMTIRVLETVYAKHSPDFQSRAAEI